MLSKIDENREQTFNIENQAFLQYFQYGKRPLSKLNIEFLQK